MNKDQLINTIGKLAAHYQEMVHTMACMYYDEVYSIEEAQEIMRNDLIKAKTYRDAFFLKYAGEQLPDIAYPLTDESHDEIARDEALVKPYL